MKWSELIKKLRLKMCLTQGEFAKFIGVSFVSVNRYENGKSEPTMKVKRLLKELFKQNDIKEEA